MVAAIAVAEDTGEGRAALEVGRDGGALKLNQNGQNANVRKLVLTVVLLLLLSFEKKYVCVESDCWDGRERVGFRTKVRVACDLEKYSERKHYARVAMDHVRSSFTFFGKGGRKKNLWIMKPVGMSRGRGIRLIDDIKNISYADKVVLQKYVGNPLLLDGYKFDLRLYVLVTSFNK